MTWTAEQIAAACELVDTRARATGRTAGECIRALCAGDLRGRVDRADLTAWHRAHARKRRAEERYEKLPETRATARRETACDPALLETLPPPEGPAADPAEEEDDDDDAERAAGRSVREALAALLRDLGADAVKVRGKWVCGTVYTLRAGEDFEKRFGPGEETVAGKTVEWRMGAVLIFDTATGEYKRAFLEHRYRRRWPAGWKGTVRMTLGFQRWSLAGPPELNVPLLATRLALLLTNYGFDTGVRGVRELERAARAAGIRDGVTAANLSARQRRLAREHKARTGGRAGFNGVKSA